MYVYPTALHNFVTSKQLTIKSLCYSHTQKQFVYILGVHGSLITVSSKRIIMHAYIKKLSKLHIWKKLAERGTCKSQFSLEQVKFKTSVKNIYEIQK